MDITSSRDMVAAACSLGGHDTASRLPAAAIDECAEGVYGTES